MTAAVGVVSLRSRACRLKVPKMLSVQGGLHVALARATPCRKVSTCCCATGSGRKGLQAEICRRMKGRRRGRRWRKRTWRRGRGRKPP
jgi:hypothetical protein